MIRIGIVGGAGYTAGELIRILLRHPVAQLQFIHSKSHAQQPIDKVHRDLVGETELSFTDELQNDIDVLFLCMGHGASKTFLGENDIPTTTKIIDLSRDFRLQATAEDFVYGLPEWKKTDIQTAQHIANPGCFATAMQLALLPLAAENLLQNDVHLQGITGSTGAGQRPSATTHFSWRNNNVSLYKTLRHQHMDEVNQSVRTLQTNYNGQLHFIPMRGNFARGILVSAYSQVDISQSQLDELYRDYYADAAFTHISSENIHLKQVVNTNKALLYVEKIDDQVVVVSAIDNLLKGASGQAVQNMNLLFGLEERMGLNLKASYF
jgi:N-acetyl-gamma-glutamyl-phosphate reductase